MTVEENCAWLESIVHRGEGYEFLAVANFSERLVRLAGSRLPERLRRRVEPEDIVQSVFRSFFTRHDAGRFSFDETADVWKVLAAITWRKVQRTVRHHSQLERDIGREAGGDSAVATVANDEPSAATLVAMQDLLDRILEPLSAVHREIIRLRLENYSIAEIASRVQVSARTVDRSLALFRRIAAEQIGE